MSEESKAAAQAETVENQGRDGKGRFTKGNRGGPGNPHARRSAHLRQLLHAASTDDEVLQVFAALKQLALAGDVQAIKLYLAYQIGTPTPAPDPDTLDQHELKIALDNHAPRDEELYHVLNGFPADLVAQMLRKLVPMMEESKKDSIRSYLADPLAKPTCGRPRCTQCRGHNEAGSSSAYPDEPGSPSHDDVEPLPAGQDAAPMQTAANGRLHDLRATARQAPRHRPRPSPGHAGRFGAPHRAERAGGPSAV